MMLGNNLVYKRLFYWLFLVLIFIFTGCSDLEEILITDRKEAYISRFILRDNDNYTIVGDVSIGNGIDTINMEVLVIVPNGADLTYLKPECTLSPESILEPVKGSPKLGTWIDFTEGPYYYYVISGDRSVQRMYTINVRKE